VAGATVVAGKVLFGAVLFGAVLFGALVAGEKVSEEPAVVGVWEAVRGPVVTADVAAGPVVAGAVAGALGAGAAPVVALDADGNSRTVHGDLVSSAAAVVDSRTDPAATAASLSAATLASGVAEASPPPLSARATATIIAATAANTRIGSSASAGCGEPEFGMPGYYPPALGISPSPPISLGRWTNGVGRGIGP
jgi:hypothetical protein